MRTSVESLKGAEKILVALAVFGYLTADQITRLLFAPSSLSYVRKLLKHLATGSFVLPLAGKAMNLPVVYTLSGVGRTYAAALGAAPRKRFRQSEEQEKGHNPYFLKHTIAVTDVLIAATLLSQTHPGIALTHLYTERELKRNGASNKRSKAMSMPLTRGSMNGSSIHQHCPLLLLPKRNKWQQR
jgi:protein involved in plasmid replication-relaxation